MSNVYEHTDKIAKQAGYEVMGAAGILEILANRETVPEEKLLALTVDDVNDLYDMFIGPAVDGIEDWVMAEK